MLRFQDFGMQYRFSLGLFGDMMQRIYGDGKEDIGINLPKNWAQPSKKMNHRSNKRIIELINNIRKSIDGQQQVLSTGKDDGFVRLFIDQRKSKRLFRTFCCTRNGKTDKRPLWDLESRDVMTFDRTRRLFYVACSRTKRKPYHRSIYR